MLEDAVRKGFEMEKKILVVDDEPQIRELLEAVFDQVGFSVVAAGSAEDALEILGRENPQIMFFDLKLPDMNGIEFCRQVRKDFPVAFIFAMTGYASLFDIGDCRRAGFDDYLVKPVAVDELQRAANDAYEKLLRWDGGNRD